MTIYVIERLDSTLGVWGWMNSYKSYTDACEALEWMRRKYRGSYRIVEVQ